MQGDKKLTPFISPWEEQRALGGIGPKRRGAEATMFAALTDRLYAQPTWRKLDEAVARMRPHCLTEIEQDEEHCLEAMLHWHSPVERSRTFHCRRHALVDDNPTSG